MNWNSQQTAIEQSKASGRDSDVSGWAGEEVVLLLEEDNLGVLYLHNVSLWSINSADGSELELEVFIVGEDSVAV